jgi:hypothetical protein
VGVPIIRIIDGVGVTSDQTRDVSSAKNSISHILFDPEPFSLKDILLYPWSHHIINWTGGRHLFLNFQVFCGIFSLMTFFLGGGEVCNMEGVLHSVVDFFPAFCGSVLPSS